MKLDVLKTANFRNLEDSTLQAGPGINVIYGDNAQGKTNLMEAIWLFTGNRSFRGAKETELITFSKEFSKLYIEFTTTERSQKAELTFGKKKTQKLNEVPLKSSSELNGTFPCVVFSPADLSLVKEGPEKRRRFLDMAIAQIKPSYRSYLAQYQKAMSQRNALMKDLFRFPSLSATVELWDMQLAKLGTILTSYRIDYLRKLEKFAQQIYDGISNGKESLKLEYDSTVFGENQKEIKYTDSNINSYYNKMQDSLISDTALGYSSVGIHRDDVSFYINENSVRAFGSQGQQRSSALAVKLAESQLLASITGEEPVMLLDDVLSELDVSRQEYILNHLERQQVFLSCCDISNTLRLKSGNIYKMENGKLDLLP